jgi:hypothetical protein
LLGRLLPLARKDNPNVEVPLIAPEPSNDARHNTILAGWQYGVGKSVAFTTDAGKRWATPWTNWESYSKLFSQVVRWSMRPVGDQGNFTTSVDVKDGKIQVVVTALDKENEFLNFLEMGANVVGPDMQPRSLTMTQVAPGRYTGEVEAGDAGSYLVNIMPGVGMAPIRTGVNIPYSPEFADRGANEGLLATLASLQPQGGERGILVEDPSGRDSLNSLLQTNHFRHDLPKATSSQDVWHLFVLVGCCLFFCDVFVRRVNVNVAWIGPLVAKGYNRLRGRATAPLQTEYMDRLRSRKAQVSSQIEERRAATRFEPQVDPEVSLEQIQADVSAPLSETRAPTLARPEMSTPKEDEDYTSRLLKAKKKVWQDREEKPN